jgi:hypothetical protein
MEKGHLPTGAFVERSYIQYLPSPSRLDLYLHILRFHNICSKEDNSRHLALVPYLTRVYSPAKSGWDADFFVLEGLP